MMRYYFSEKWALKSVGKLISTSSFYKKFDMKEKPYILTTKFLKIFIL